MGGAAGAGVAVEPLAVVSAGELRGARPWASASCLAASAAVRATCLPRSSIS